MFTAMITVVVKGLEIRCESIADVRVVVDAFGAAQSASATGRGRPPKNGHSTQQQIQKTRDMERTACFLRLVNDRKRVGADDIVSALKLGGPRGVGGALVVVRRVVADYLNLNPDDVYLKSKDAITRDAYWKPKEKIVDALTALNNGQPT
jgi:hypothetical protein